jgi:hypothetical protein
MSANPQVTLSGSAVVPRRDMPPPLVYAVLADDELGSIAATYWAREPSNRTRPLTLVDMHVSTVTDLDAWLRTQDLHLEALARDLGVIADPPPGRPAYHNFLVQLTTPLPPAPLFFCTSTLLPRSQANGLAAVGISDALQGFSPDERQLRSAAIHDIAFSPLAAEKCRRYPYNAIATPRYGQPPSGIAASFAFGALLGGASEYFTR